MMVRIDMGEYMEKHTVSRLIGAPPGYIGHDEGGQLTEAVRRRPYSVVLLDEVEKAHHDVMNVLLGVLDDGRLTDAKGRTVSFANTVIIMTSNLGSDILLMGGNTPEARDRVMAVVKRHFRPEFLNRLDDVVMFEPLDATRMRKVARMMAMELNDRLRPKSIIMTMTDSALDYAVQQSYDPLYGARPLRRWLEQNIITDLSRMIVAGHLQENSKVIVSAEEGKGLQYRVEKLQVDASAPPSFANGKRKLNLSPDPTPVPGLHEDDLDDDEMDDE
jgi:ATP-dependent Clp protease ATP-binding subunit ClpB